MVVRTGLGSARAQVAAGLRVLITISNSPILSDGQCQGKWTSDVVDSGGLGGGFDGKCFFWLKYDVDRASR